MNLWENCFPRVIRPAVTFQSRDFLLRQWAFSNNTVRASLPLYSGEGTLQCRFSFSVYELYVSLHFWDNLQDNQCICNAFSRKGLLGMDVIKNVITFWKNDYRKLPKISPGAFIFQRVFLRGFFWRGLYSEGLIYRGKLAFQNRLG